jgi:hypothetical protein
MDYAPKDVFTIRAKNLLAYSQARLKTFSAQGAYAKYAAEPLNRLMEVVL